MSQIRPLWFETHLLSSAGGKGCWRTSVAALRAASTERGTIATPVPAATQATIAG